jgi:hypothetical protein
MQGMMPTLSTTPSAFHNYTTAEQAAYVGFMILLLSDARVLTPLKLPLRRPSHYLTSKSGRLRNVPRSKSVPHHSMEET